ncbi:GNAT family N-acetyltransferase [Ideonella dechloratans]|uniref:GNAT family N-acetyltransferase n=1 Tax=Ideonella dechloratans TaxID=36863 RepID=UPI0035B095BA
MISLAPVTHQDHEDLLQFEQENRAFFEAHVTARPAGYDSGPGLAAAIEKALREADEDQGYQYLIRDAQSQLIGRINLSRVRRAHFHSAELGYRIAQRACGQGHASAAVRQMLDLAFGPLGLRRLEAHARPTNPASVRVLQRCGFVQFGHSRRSMELQGVWHDRLYFERHRETTS